MLPELARFLGIVIGIFPREHPPPHFHAVYGDFPKRALRHVLEWLDLHEGELMQNWDRIQAGRPGTPIAPLE